MRDIPIDPIKFEGFDAAERVQGYANIFCLPVTIMKGGDIVAIVLYRREVAPTSDVTAKEAARKKGSPPMLSFLIEIDYGTAAGKLTSATATVNANDYEQAYTMFRAHVVKTRRPARIIGARAIGRAYPSVATVPGIVATKLEVVETSADVAAFSIQKDLLHG